LAGGVAALAVLLLGAIGCGGDAPLPPSAFGGAGGGPALEPERFFEGRTLSFGVFEDAGGAPSPNFSPGCRDWLR
jgi:hypothetical protein